MSPLRNKPTTAARARKHSNLGHADRAVRPPARPIRGTSPHSAVHLRVSAQAASMLETGTAPSPQGFPPEAIARRSVVSERTSGVSPLATLLLKEHHMRLAITFIAGVLLCTPATAQDKPPASANPPAGENTLKTVHQKACYYLGYRFASGLAKDGIELDLPALVAGIRDAAAKKNSKLTEAEARRALDELSTILIAREKKRMAELQKKNATFLEENKKNEGVVALPSGLQYKVVKQGSGPKPKATDTVTVHYTGKLIDGTVFDSSVERGRPASFPPNRVIPGWTEGLQLMPVGSKYILYIPGKLAYGKNPPRGSGIYPDAVLVFEVELLRIGR